MRIIIAQPSVLLPIGKKGQNNATAIDFDCTEWLKEYPSGSIGLFVTKPNATTSYPASLLTVINGFARWTVTNADLATVGYGHVELVLVSGGDVIKSETYETVTRKSEVDDSQSAPQGWTEYVATVVAKGNLAKTSADTAVAKAKEASDSATLAGKKAGEASGHATTATNKAKDAKDSADAAKESEDKALEYKGDTSDLYDAIVLLDANVKSNRDDAVYASDNAGAAQLACMEQATKAEGYSSGTKNGNPVPSTSPYYNNNAKYFSEQAHQEYLNIATIASNDDDVQYIKGGN